MAPPLRSSKVSYQAGGEESQDFVIIVIGSGTSVHASSDLVGIARRLCKDRIVSTVRFSDGPGYSNPSGHERINYGELWEAAEIAIGCP
jgi:hypothetical protein